MISNPLVNNIIITHSSLVYNLFGQVNFFLQFLKSKAIAALPAFLLSSAVHDYHVGVGMGFFTPIFLIMFAGIGGVCLVCLLVYTIYHPFIIYVIIILFPHTHSDYNYSTDVPLPTFLFAIGHFPDVYWSVSGCGFDRIILHD